jgi:tRNA(fMet)-specific endonuclease VapC
MIKYMLDTNICIYLMNEQPEEVIAKFKKCRKGEVVISSITWAELSGGLNIHNDETQFEEFLSAIKVMPFEIKAASIFGELSQKFPSRNSSFDRMIAAHAISLGVVLVTNNVSDFELYGMTVENWAI